MARKTATVVIDAPGRDKDKVFFLTEMDADKGEEWALRAILTLTHANPEIGDVEELQMQGWGGIVALGFKAFANLSFTAAKPLLDEMMECVEIIPNPKDVRVKRALFPGDIEEIGTRLKLRAEVFNLHADFSALVAGLTSNSTAAGDPQNTQNIATSPRASGRSSQRGSQR